MSILAESMKIKVDDEESRLSKWMKNYVFREFKRRGAVIGVSGGIDSSVVLALAVRALGNKRVVALAMPEKDSSPDSLELAIQLSKKFDVELLKTDLFPALDALGCYNNLTDAIKETYSDYDPKQDKVKLVLPDNLLNKPSLNIFSLVLMRPNQSEERKILSPQAYLGIVAASNMKQRMRMLNLYYHAEKRNYAVLGTGNKNEHYQGFFVKYGDGGADLQPIRHLYKTQVYQLARYLDIPQTIIERIPTTDTYSAGSTQEEFYFRVPFELLDKIWLGMEMGMSTSKIADDLDLTAEQVKRVMDDLIQKERTTEYLRTAPLAIQD